MKRPILIIFSLLLFPFAESCGHQEGSNSTRKNEKTIINSEDKQPNTTILNEKPASIGNNKNLISFDEREQTSSNKEKKSTISFDEQKYYRLTSQFVGGKMSLHIIDDDQDNKVNLEETGDYPNQAWKIQSLTNGYFRLTTQWQGEGKSLDVYKDKAKHKKLWLEASNNHAGQAWKIQPVGNGYYNLSTQLLGEDKSLDVLSNTNNKGGLMETGDYSGQLWKITEFNK